ncbi:MULTISPECIES: SDR family NAD(P)-dependent oxidoreductase [Rhizobium]|uniref:SDR family NAD(P)-dependent oxidoreductase n=1 Tax=Rhizobium TaxID=379 RepID=UPI000A1E97A4|nr:MULTISPECIES: SDR family NAD(P)-dependent oxidoreductase [Rhizobium]ARM90937.1 3-oxoacyl-(acyl-carrier-protein) reductase protein [Rhizobium sp. CIAT894]MBB4299526.1 3-oxoacyl-[acyl-carrier protein] reductase [Rhizobium leguminosarum]MBB4310964.1 3-oxoacyl-[acyl-carrier protein] reductase [Rhizobium leguminosarum]MBB4419924.1 3-oxoacyl-[acyl-carrier protein] reductase [Rhizobium leguminosarum]MBB4435080.1 3-oxoacyl-[acyl-carrier protein] reductase [Rhizobium esperanzae]
MHEQTRTVLVTGASRGIGKAIAVGMAKRGYDVVINDIERQRDALAEVAVEIESFGRRALIVFADVSNKADVGRMAGEVRAAFGHLDAVVNNAGILISGDVEGLKEEYWDSVMDVNAKGTFLVIQSVLPMMKARKYGRIVNIASIGGKHGAPEQAHYSASKAAVMGFTRVLAQEVGVDGITANCVCPGIILTDMGRVNLDDPAVRKGWQDKTAMRRIGDPEDVVGAVAFFASGDAAFITGQTLNVDGGIVLS